MRGLESSTLAALGPLSRGGAPDLNISGPMTKEKAKQAGVEFESVFLSNVLSQMFSTLEQGDGPLGAGGTGGETYRSFLTDEYAKEIANNGGIGIADQVMRELLATQETGA
jgi:peptidoglycan hydrolase FlgJ